jgi:glycosyltransferase involved in cell wall biosynthesis
MRILLATPLYPPEIGGPATYTRELAQRLCLEHEITIVAFADEPEHIKNTRLVVVSKKVFLPLRLLMYAYILFREAKEADVIYVQNAVAAGLPAVFVGAMRRKPVVLKFVGDEAWERATQATVTDKTLEGFLANPPANFRALLLIEIQKFVLNRATKIVPPSQFLARVIEKYYGVRREKIEVNYNAFDLHTRPDVQKKPHQIASVGRLVAWKGIDGVIRAVDMVRKEYTVVKLVIAGSGPEESNLKKLVQDHSLESTITFVGRLSREETQKLQAESEVQVLNSTYEGLPHIALESFAARVPLVATDIGGTNEAVLNEKTGLLV